MVPTLQIFDMKFKVRHIVCVPQMRRIEHEVQLVRQIINVSENLSRMKYITYLACTWISGMTLIAVCINY